MVPRVGEVLLALGWHSADTTLVLVVGVEIARLSLCTSRGGSDAVERGQCPRLVIVVANLIAEHGRDGVLLAKYLVEGEVVAEERTVVLALAGRRDGSHGQGGRAGGLQVVIDGGIVVHSVAHVEGFLRVVVGVGVAARLVLELAVELQSVDDVHLQTQLGAHLRIVDAVAAVACLLQEVVVHVVIAESAPVVEGAEDMGVVARRPVGGVGTVLVEQHLVGGEVGQVAISNLRGMAVAVHEVQPQVDSKYLVELIAVLPVGLPGVVVATDEVALLMLILQGSSRVPSAHVGRKRGIGLAHHGRLEHILGYLLAVVEPRQLFELRVHLVLAEGSPVHALVEQGLRGRDTVVDVVEDRRVFLAEVVVLEHPLLVVDGLSAGGKVGEMLHVLLGTDSKLGACLHLHGVFLLALLGGDDDHAIGRAGTPNAGCGSILQHGYALHVVGIDALQGGEVGIGGELVVHVVVVHDGIAVHHHQRSLVGVHRAGASDGELLPSPSVVLTLHAGHESVEGIGEVGGVTLFQVILADDGIRPRGTLARNGLITSHHHVVQLVVGGHHDIMGGIAFASSQMIRRVVHAQIDISHLASVGRHPHLIVTIDIGHRLDVGATHPDEGANDWFSILILHRSLEEPVAREFLRHLLGHHHDVAFASPLTVLAAQHITEHLSHLGILHIQGDGAHALSQVG